MLLHNGIKGQMTEVRGVGRRRAQLLDDLRNRRKYWELKELKIEEDGNDNLPIVLKEKIQAIFYVNELANKKYI